MNVGAGFSTGLTSRATPDADNKVRDRLQCLDVVLRMFVTPPSGSMLGRSLKSNSLLFARSLSARVFATSNEWLIGIGHKIPAGFQSIGLRTVSMCRTRPIATSERM